MAVRIVFPTAIFIWGWPRFHYRYSLVGLSATSPRHFRKSSMPVGFSLLSLTQKKQYY